jgi:TPR repeat protein
MAEQGNADAQYLLWDAYYRVEGLARDLVEAARWWRMAADQENMAGNVVGCATAKLHAIKTAQLTGDLPRKVNFAVNAAAARALLDANG